ncbi:MAG: hypothetical protein CBB92_04845 [Flammeovirgaceae bacterium TMED32]|nr:MAG: hypothetical protein CBB92_04845 [Flammeovirgaceae bacterium TMED32]
MFSFLFKISLITHSNMKQIWGNKGENWQTPQNIRNIEFMFYMLLNYYSVTVWIGNTKKD